MIGDNFINKLLDRYHRFQYKHNLKHRRNLYEYNDTGYLHLWAKEDYPKIRREYDLIRAGVLPVNTIATKIRRIWNDQKYGTKFYNKFHRFEPEQFAIDDKYLVVKEGQVYFSKCHVGKLSGPPDYIALGTNATTPTFADFNLNSEVIRANLLRDGGYRDLFGEDEYYGMIWPVTVGTATYSEAGLFVGANAAVGDIMITHNKFSPALSHTQNDNAPGLEIIIKYRSYVA